MRIGSNPMRGLASEPYPQVVSAAITHLPETESDYHRGRLEIVQLCLNSMRYNAGRDLPILVWDNGSGPELRSWLLEEYRPEYLVLSPNAGKAGARTSILRMFPPGTAINVSDDDMYYYPGWLEPQLELLRGFPNVGVVSGYPVRTQFRWGNAATMRWAAQFARISTGKLIPQEWDDDFAVSIGRKIEDQRAMTVSDLDTLIEYQGLKAYATAHHCQFLAYTERVEYIVQWDGQAVSDEREFDKAVDAQGYLRLTTTERLVRHIGNVIEPELRADISGAEYSGIGLRANEAS